MACEYPRDLATFFNGKDKTLNIEAHMHRASIQNGASPYQNYSEFARFKFTYIEGGKYYEANIRPSKDVPDITARTEYANRRIFEYEMTQNSSAQSVDGAKLTTPAYTVRLGVGSLKGKTPAEVFAEKGEAAKEILSSQYLFLRENLEKYPKNKIQMDAIEEALRAFNSGSLKRVEKGASGSSIAILKPEMRPLTRREKKYDKTFVYEIGIMCYPDHNYPYEVKISNYYAPVDKLPDGRLNVRKAEAQDLVEKAFFMTTKDWNALVQAMNTHMRQFEDVIARTQFAEAETADEENRMRSNVPA